MGMKRRLCKQNHNSIHTTEPTSELLLLKVVCCHFYSWYFSQEFTAGMISITSPKCEGTTIRKKKKIYILLDSSVTITKLKHLVSCIGFLKPILWAHALASRRAGIFSLNSKSFCNQRRFRKWKFIDSKVPLLCNQIINKIHNHF